MADKIAHFRIDRVRGMNDSDPPTSLAEDVAVLAQNVEWIKARVGQRRAGTDAIDLTGSGLTSHDEVTFLGRYLPSKDVTQAELFALGVTGTASATLARKDTSWHTVSPVDAFELASGSKYEMRMVSLRQKGFLAYDSPVDRLHVWDGTDLRRVGLAAPTAAPTAANSGGAGTLAGTRYYRVRWTRQDAGTTILRSEPSDALTFTPSTTNASVTVTRPTTVGADAGITHWELEAALEQDGDFFVIATTAIATTTATDSTAFSPGYGPLFELSEDIGDYTLPWSARFLLADNDRLLFLGSHEDEALGSRVGWTPVAAGPGVGNSERMEADTTPYTDLDPGVGGDITDHSTPVNGVFYVFKLGHIYRLVRTGVRSRAYEAFMVTDEKGAVPGSVVNGFDQAGRPCVYFSDPEEGPCRIGFDGVKNCGLDIRETWKTFNQDADVPCRSVYHRGNKQWHLWFAAGSSEVPNRHVVLNTAETREVDDGVRCGWAIWPGASADVLAVTMFADNINANTTRSKKLVPFIGKTGDGFIQRTGTGTTDNGQDYNATVLTRPFVMGNLLDDSEVMAGAVLAKATPATNIVVQVVRDFGVEESADITVSLAPAASETHVIRLLDNLGMGELKAMQFRFSDEDTPSGQWELNGLSLKMRTVTKTS